MFFLLQENFRGAESKLFIQKWLDFPVVAKKRVPKEYRVPELDFSFRKQRTIHEARLISRAKKAGVLTPIIYEIDISNTTLIMELIEGIILKKILPNMAQIEQKKISFDIGYKVGLLHREGIVHGDLTTSNIILNKRNELVFVDFGLGFITDRIEDFGIDVYLLERAFISTHTELFEILWEKIIEGYKESSPYGNEIEEKILEIASRGRYSERV